MVSDFFEDYIHNVVNVKPKMGASDSRSDGLRPEAKSKIKVIRSTAFSL
jgi:hypothetical protein